jgi:hypothetical protein
MADEIRPVAADSSIFSVTDIAGDVHRFRPTGFPPLVEVNAITSPLNPVDRDNHLPLRLHLRHAADAVVIPAVAIAGPQVCPPSVEVLIWIRSPSFVSSHSE